MIYRVAQTILDPSNQDRALVSYEVPILTEKLFFSYIFYVSKSLLSTNHFNYFLWSFFTRSTTHEYGFSFIFLDLNVFLPFWENILLLRADLDPTSVLSFLSHTILKKTHSPRVFWIAGFYGWRWTSWLCIVGRHRKKNRSVFIYLLYKSN